MALLAWTGAFSVGVKDIDDQHKILIDRANALNEAMKIGLGADVTGQVLGDLISYTETHFAFEEQLMDRYQFPLAPNHKLQHRELVKAVIAFKDKFEHRDAVAADMMVFLRDWLTRHIMNSDKMFAKHLNKNGVF